MKINVAYNQVMIDMALQGCGDATRIFEVAQLNGSSITDDLVSGSIIETPSAELTKQKLVNLFSINANRPSSGDITLSTPEGIGYWFIENDFIVQ